MTKNENHPFQCMCCGLSLCILGLEFIFILFQIYYHTLPYPQNKGIESKIRTTEGKIEFYNICIIPYTLCCLNNLLVSGLEFFYLHLFRLNLWDLFSVVCTLTIWKNIDYTLRKKIQKWNTFMNLWDLCFAQSETCFALTVRHAVFGSIFIRGTQRQFSETYLFGRRFEI